MGKKVFLRSGFRSANNMKPFLAFLYTQSININIISMNIIWFKLEELL